MVYGDRFERRYGFFRPYVKQVIYRYLDCGILHHGFARVRCEDCGHEYLLAFSCKRRHFCPSCHQKRVVEFGEWLCHEIVKVVPHRHAVLSIPKILRRYFLYDRKLLSDLSRCGWEALKLYLKKAAKGKKAVPEMFACPDCGMDVEIWTDEIKGKSTFCNKMFQKDKFVMPTMLFILIILNDQPLNIKEQRHWDGEMFAVISGLNVRLLRPADITKSIKKS